MRDRRLHDHGEDKLPSPCLHPFCCLTFPHVFIISLTCLSVSYRLSVRRSGRSCLLFPLFLPPAHMFVQPVNIVSCPFQILHKRPALYLLFFFDLTSPILSPTPSLTLNFTPLSPHLACPCTLPKISRDLECTTCSIQSFKC